MLGTVINDIQCDIRGKFKKIDIVLFGRVEQKAFASIAIMVIYCIITNDNYTHKMELDINILVGRDVFQRKMGCVLLFGMNMGMGMTNIWSYEVMMPACMAPRIGWR